MYENAQWIDVSGEQHMIRIDIFGATSFVPIDPENTDYQRIMELVAKGELTIAPAEDK